MCANRRGCLACEPLLPEYVDACLRGAAVSRLYPAVYRHLAGCTACALWVAEAVSAIRLREAEEPFNAHVLPVPALAKPLGPAGGSPRVH